MQACFTTYCDLPFLDRYYQAKPTGDPALYNEEAMLWLEMHQFLIRESDVVLKASPDDLHALLPQYPFLKYLLDRPAGTRMRLDPDHFTDLESPAAHQSASCPWRLYFIEETKTPNTQLTASLGALFLRAADATATWRRIGRQTLLNVSHRNPDTSIRSWDALQDYATPLSSLVICDRYIFKDQTRMEENLGELVVNLLPEGPNEVPVEILLITQEVHCSDLTRLHERLNNHLKAQRPQLKFSLAIVKTVKSGLEIPETHDRSIFMNYGFVRSGQSFNYFADGKVDRKTSTTLDFTPILNRNNLQTAVEKLRDLGRWVANTPEMIGPNRYVVGSKHNRLLQAALNTK